MFVHMLQLRHPLGMLHMLLRVLRLLCTAFLLRPLRLLQRVSGVLHVLCLLCMLCMLCLLGVLRQLLQLRGVQRCLLHSWRRPEPAALRFLQQLQQPGPRRARLIGSPIVVLVGAHRLHHGLRLGRQPEPLLPLLLLYQRRLLRLPVSLIGRGVGRLREHRAWGMDACALGGTRSSWRRRRLRAGLPRVLLGCEMLVAFYFIKQGESYAESFRVIIGYA